MYIYDYLMRDAVDKCTYTVEKKKKKTKKYWAEKQLKLDFEKEEIKWEK